MTLSLTGISVRYGGVHAVKDVNLEFEKGELIAVVGPNGAGKSTLLNAISGLAGRDISGDLILEGTSLAQLSPTARARKGIGRSFQDPRLVGTMSVLENVISGSPVGQGYNLIEHFTRWNKVARYEAELTERALAILGSVGLLELRDTSAASIPYGARKLVDVARALMCRPKVLLLDEPSSGLDHAEQAAVVKILNELHDTNTMAILIVEHHMDLVRASATRVLGLQSGEVIADGPTGDVLDSAAFQAALVGAPVHQSASEPAASVREA